MTAFARAGAGAGAAVGTLVVELRSVNHRYLDCHFKLPEELRSLEPAFREALGKALDRGKVDCLVRLQTTPGDRPLELDRARLTQVLDACREIAGEEDTVAKPDPLAVLQFPGVARTASPAEDEITREARAVFDEALASLRETRAREGARLAVLVRDRIDAVAREVDAVRARVPALREHQQTRLRQRLAELTQALDTDRLEQELAYLAQKTDVDEELDRLDAHVAEVRRVLDAGGPCGRRLDFLMQELNREANTLSSKSTGITQTQGAIELKVLIEQIREQVQNIE
ncbi:YicC/YloC family endoribonuclease [Pseudohaliea rubra]|nr:YicC/YloC family endoribonuclease [Pseudohaliea rubra]